MVLRIIIDCSYLRDDFENHHRLFIFKGWFWESVLKKLFNNDQEKCCKNSTSSKISYLIKLLVSEMFHCSQIFSVDFPELFFWKRFFRPQDMIGLLQSILGIFRLRKFGVVWVYFDLPGVVIWQHIHPTLVCRVH